MAKRDVGSRGRARARRNGKDARNRVPVDALESRLLMAATDVLINEIMFNTGSAQINDEYLELYNKGATPVNLTGWKFTKGVNYTFGNQTIAAGGYLVIAA